MRPLLDIPTWGATLLIAATATAAEPGGSLSGEGPRGQTGLRPLAYLSLPQGESDSAADDQPEGQQEQDEEEEDSADDEQEGTLLAPGWHRAGPIAVEYYYYGEVFNNARGGISTNDATRYRGSLDLTMTLDTQQAGWWEGGKFCVYLQQTHGRTLTQRFVGDGQYYSSIDTGYDQDITQLGEYWYEHALEPDVWTIRWGRQDANEHFAYADMGWEFVNSSFLTLGNIPLPVWPYQTMGVTSLYQASDKLQLGGGVFDHGRDRGEWWNTTSSRGIFTIAQADYHPHGDDDEAPAYILRLGTWFTSSDTEAVDGLTTHDNNYGFYVTAERMILPERDDAAQGLGAFCQYSWTPGDRNMVDHHYGAGLVYFGLFDDRDQDTCGVGFTMIDFSSTVRRQTGATSENAIEIFYRARVTDWLIIQPDMQYIARPSGVQRDALVVGVRTETRF